MRVLILAGGLGTRLQSVVKHVPKPMAPVQNRPFLEYLLDFWKERRASHFYLSIGHLANKIEDHFSNEYRGIDVTRIIEREPLGTGGGLLYALSQIDTDEDIVVINGDTYFEVDFERMLDLHKQKKSKLTIGLREVELNDRYSGVVLNEDGQITQIAQREPESNHLLINAGVYIINPSFIKQAGFKAGEKLSLEDDLFPKLIQTKEVYGFASKGRFIDIGIPKDYELAQEFFTK